MNEFKENKYKIVQNVMSKELTDFIYKYFLLKRNAVLFYLNSNLLPKNTIEKINTPFIGTQEDELVSNTYSEYGDFCMETLLSHIKPILEIETKLKLIETFSYARIYKKGDVLKKHTDRKSCEIAVSLNLGGQEWPIYLKDINNNEIEIKLNPSDILIYKGSELVHWRNKFEGHICVQVFLFYNDIEGPFKFNKYDTRPFLGCMHSERKIKEIPSEELKEKLKDIKEKTEKVSKQNNIAPADFPKEFREEWNKILNN